MKTVFLVDGSSSFLKYLEFIIKRLGFETRTAKGRKAFLESVRFAPPDMVMCETKLPDGDGIALCRSIKNDPAIAKTHVVLVSTDGSEETRKEAFENGCTEYLTKPVKSRTVFRLLEETIGQRRRKKMRVAYDLTVSVIFPGGQSRDLQASNFGEGGMFVLTEDSPAVGTFLGLGFKLPGFLDPFSLKGEVVYAIGERAEGLTPGMGIRFADVDEETQARLSNYMEDFVEGGLRNGL